MARMRMPRAQRLFMDAAKGLTLTVRLRRLDMFNLRWEAMRLILVTAVWLADRIGPCNVRFEDGDE
jgi:hypothetical protein